MELDCSTQCVCPFVITDPTGDILARFGNEWERNEALLTGEFPEDAEPAYVNEVE